MRKIYRSLIPILKFLLSIAVAAGVFVAVIGFVKKNPDTAEVNIPFFLQSAKLFISELTSLQKFILICSGILVVIGLYKLFLEREILSSILFLYIAVFYGTIFFLITKKVLIIDTVYFVPLIAVGEVMVAVSNRHFQEDRREDSFISIVIQNIAIQLFLIVPGCIIAYLAGMTVMDKSHTQDSKMHLFYIQIVIFAVMFFFQCITAIKDFGRGISEGNYLNSMTGDEGTGSDMDVSNY